LHKLSRWLTRFENNLAHREILWKTVHNKMPGVPEFRLSAGFRTIKVLCAGGGIRPKPLRNQRLTEYESCQLRFTSSHSLRMALRALLEWRNLGISKLTVKLSLLSPEDEPQGEVAE
jgi:hypothetical protein